MRARGNEVLTGSWLGQQNAWKTRCCTPIRHFVGPVGLEPTTRGLKVRCSAIALEARGDVDSAYADVQSFRWARVSGSYAEAQIDQGRYDLGRVWESGDLVAHASRGLTLGG
jgi:hypothetical protein